MLRLITLLESGRSYTANELAEELEVSRRTIFRDLNMLELARIPYYFDPASGGYKISRHFFLPPVNLTITEALAILTLAGGLRNAKRLPLLAHGARAAGKLEAALPPAIREHVGSVMEHLSVSLGPLARHEGMDPLFAQLTEAATSRSVCRIVYISFHERKQIAMDVHPLRLTFAGRAWYLIAWSVQHKQVRTFKLGRIRKLIVKKETFTPPPRMDLDNPFGQAWGMIPEGKLYDVHLHFESKVAGNVAEVRWHGSQRVEFNDDGSAEFHATVDGLGEIAWWILGYGDQVEVVAPKELRKRVADVAASMVRKYSTKTRGKGR